MELQLDAALDELWLLQTVPAYFYELAVQLKESWVDVIPGVNDWSDTTKI